MPGANKWPQSVKPQAHNVRACAGGALETNKQKKTYCQAAEKVFNGLLSDIIGQVSQEGCVGRAAGQLRPVDVGFTGRPGCCGQDGAVDGRSSVAVLLRVPGGRH